MTDIQSARTEILAAIRSAIGAPRVLTAADSWQAIPREYQQHGALDETSCLAMLEDRLHDYGAGVHHAARAEIVSVIAAILRKRNKRRILLPDGIDPSWLGASKLPEDISFVREKTGVSGALSHQDLDDCDGVLTGCTLAIALTGTLVLCHGQELSPQHTAGRRALTLIPDYHLCVVEKSSVVETVAEAFRRLEQYKTQPITFISGPSATADIEMTRIQGVHGPRTLDVLLVG